ncbi:MAG: hypothetical protein IPP74_04585 [Alphaproteobacteria bacterium]|nr:hypothetical protein [Alphaproteobacteria bacterium]
MKHRCFYFSDFLLILCLASQITFWYNTKGIKPEMEIVPNPPGERAAKALAFGDEQFYFYELAFMIQNAGDTFGRFSAFNQYDFSKLYRWFLLLDTLDSRSNLIPSLASYYFSATQQKDDVRYIVNYLEKHADHDINHKWWWMYQACYLANHTLGDKELALKLAYKLAKTDAPGVPIWVKQFPAFIHAELNEDQEALVVIKRLLDNEKNLDQGEVNFMNYFIKLRLDKIEGKKEHSKP